MAAIDEVEQLRAARLQPECARRVANLGPFGLKILVYEAVRQLADFEDCRLGILPIDFAIARQRHRAGEMHPPVGKLAQLLTRMFAALGLVAAADTLDGHHAVATDDPRFAVGLADLQRLGSSQSMGKLLRPLVHHLVRILVDPRRNGRVIDAGSFQHLASDGAGGGENERQRTTLWKTAGDVLARAWGQAQRTPSSRSISADPMIHPRWADFAPSL